MGGFDRNQQSTISACWSSGHEALAGSDCSEPVLTRAPQEPADIGMKIGRPRTNAEVTERMQHGSQRNCLSKGTDRHHFLDPIAPISVRRHRQHGVRSSSCQLVRRGPLGSRRVSPQSPALPNAAKRNTRASATACNACPAGRSRDLLVRAIQHQRPDGMSLRRFDRTVSFSVVVKVADDRGQGRQRCTGRTESRQRQSWIAGSFRYRRGRQTPSISAQRIDKAVEAVVPDISQRSAPK